MDVYNQHLQECPNKPAMIEDDKKINETVDEIIKKHEGLKSKTNTNFVCPYCGRKYKSENLKHLLGCVDKNPDDNEKLRAFFMKSWFCLESTA